MAKIYHFTQRKKFDYTVKKLVRGTVDALTPQAIFSFLLSFLKNLLPFTRKHVQVIEEKSEVQKRVEQKALIAIVASILIFFVGVGGLYFFLLLLQPPPPSFSSSSYFDIDPIYGGTSNVRQGNKVLYTSYGIFQISTENCSNLTGFFRYYDKPLQEKVFVVDPPRSFSMGSETAPEFIAELTRLLNSQRVQLERQSFVSFIQSFNITNNSIIILPLGIVPENVLFSIGNLTKNNNIIIYIGHPPTTHGVMGTTEIIPKTTPTQWLTNHNYPFSTERVFVWYYSEQNTTVHPGAIVVFSKPLDTGWKRPSEAAQDVFSTIINRTWTSPFLTETKTFSLDQQPRVFNVTLFSSPHFVEKGGFAVAQFTASCYDGKNYSKQVSYTAPRTFHGTLRFDASVVNGSLYLAELTIYEPRPPLNYTCVNFHIMNTSNFRLLKTAFENCRKIFISPNNTIPIDQPILIELPYGDYRLQALDDRGYVFAEAYFRVPYVTILPPDRWASPTISFTLLKDGQRLNPTDYADIRILYENYSFTIGETITSKNVPLITAFYSNESSEMFIVLDKSLLPEEGKAKNFTFIYSGIKTTIPVTYAPVTSTPPHFWIMGGLTVLIFIFGYLFSAKSKEYYYIDIPDFLPVKKSKIPIAQPMFLLIFDHVNHEYHWKYMPLTTTELKMAFSKIVHDGRPLSVTESNILRVLEQLISTGVVWKELGLYGLTKWESESKRSRKYLAMFRVLRTLFVNNSIPFTDINERTDCDIVISVRNSYLYLHISPNQSPSEVEHIAERVIKNVSAGVNLIIVCDADALSEFRRTLNQLSTRAAAALRLEIDKGSVIIVTLDKILSLLT